MEQWDREYLDLVVPAYIRFAQGGRSEFQFGTVRGFLDCRLEEDGGIARVEFSWEGESGGDPARGRGWAEMRAGGVLEGRLYFHMGDESGFTARRRRVGPKRVERRGGVQLVYWAFRPRKGKKP